MDNDIVKIITKTLDRFNVEYWVDFDQLETGDRLYKKINDGLQSSTHFLLVWTRNAEKSFWVEAERAAAVELGDKLEKISYKLDDIPLGVPFAAFIYSSARKDNLVSVTEELAKKISDFETFLTAFKGRIKEEYENLPEPPTKPLISNFRKFDGARFYVQQRYKNISSNEEGPQVAEYLLKLIEENLQRMESERSFRKRCSRIRVKRSEVRQRNIICTSARC